MRLRESLGTIYDDEVFADLFSSTGRPAEAPWRLALVSVVQYVEDLSDRQDAEAVRARIDWKYVLLRRVAHGGIPDAIRKNKKGGSWVIQPTWT